jgi:hypothetical protein
LLVTSLNGCKFFKDSIQKLYQSKKYEIPFKKVTSKIENVWMKDLYRPDL